MPSTPSKPAVTPGPGAMALTRIPCGAHASARLFVKLITPALAAPYGAIRTEPCSPAMEELLRMTPRFWGIMWRPAALGQRKPPGRVIATTVFQPLGLIA